MSVKYTRYHATQLNIAINSKDGKIFLNFENKDGVISVEMLVAVTDGVTFRLQGH